MGAYNNSPDMMAIGDSLYQGVRSLTFNAALGRYAVPKLVANALGIAQFDTPNWNYNLLFDMEELFRAGGLIHLIETIGPVILANLPNWLAPGSWNGGGPEAFENVAIGGADIGQVYSDSYASKWPAALALANQMLAAGKVGLSDGGDLWYALNVCATLNPSRGAAMAGKTQFDQVFDRKPKTLLVNIGSNEGLFHAAFVGDFGPATLQSVANIPAKMKQLALKLQTLPNNVERIVFNSLIRPRTASNLWPPADPSDYPGDDYFDTYVPRIGTGAQITGATLKNFDNLIYQVNGQTKAMLQSVLGARLVWVDLYAASDANDGKHYANRGVSVHDGANDLTLRNTPLEVTPFFTGFQRGGLTGLDNMHPTVPGYAIIANAVLNAMGESASVDINQAYLNDTLLQNLPASLAVDLIEFGLLGSFGVFGGSIQPGQAPTV